MPPSSRPKNPFPQKRKHNARLHALTKDVHTRLPREVRDMIYMYLLTPHEVHRISRCSKTRMDRFPYMQGSEPEEFRIQGATKPLPPHFIDPKTVHPGFAAEVMEMQHESYRHFWIDMPSAIPAFLDTDFLELGAAPKHARLSALHVSGHLDAKEPNAINLNTLARDFQALSSASWAPKFDLEITFRTDLGIMRYFHQRDLTALAHTMHYAWQILRPWIEDAENRGARVYFVLLTRGKLYRYIDGEDNMPNSLEEWEQDIFLTLGQFYLGHGSWSQETYYATGMELWAPCVFTM